MQTYGKNYKIIEIKQTLIFVTLGCLKCLIVVTVVFSKFWWYNALVRFEQPYSICKLRTYNFHGSLKLEIRIYKFLIVIESLFNKIIVEIKDNMLTYLEHRYLILF